MLASVDGLCMCYQIICILVMNVCTMSACPWRCVGLLMGKYIVYVASDSVYEPMFSMSVFIYLICYAAFFFFSGTMTFV